MTLLKFLIVLASQIVCALGLFLLTKETRFGQVKYMARQVIYGVVFGGLAILATELGFTVDGATLNIRDAAPITASLVFGPVAGIIAGVIGGVERWFAVLWGAGAYTQLACTISTVVAGVAAGALRKYMFDGRRPPWLYCAAIAMITEVFHMLMIFLTNMSDVRQAFSVIISCAFPMIILNTVSVGGTMLLITIINSTFRGKKIAFPHLVERVQGWLIIGVVSAFLITVVFSFVLQTKLARNDAKELMLSNIADMTLDVEQASDAHILEMAHLVAKDLDSRTYLDQNYMDELLDKFSVSEISLVNNHGDVTISSNPRAEDYNMITDEQFFPFLSLLSKTEEMVQAYQPEGEDISTFHKYAGVKFRNGFVLIGYDITALTENLANQVAGVTRNRHVGSEGYMLVANEEGLVVSDPNGREGESISLLGLSLDGIQPGEAFQATVDEKECYCLYQETEGYAIIALMPMEEVDFNRKLSIYIVAFMEIIVFGLLFGQIYFAIKRKVVQDIDRINLSLARITAGDLNEIVDVRTSREFNALSNDINATVDTLKRYIAEAEERNAAEMEFAKSIQYSALPSDFPAYPDRPEFDLFARMDTAKEVGGDFYDFYMLGENRLAFLIADVSGKGIPAALFMMRSKTMIKSLAESHASAAEIFTLANQRLCEGNDAGMFVTGWLGILDLTTGMVDIANAGHNPPLVRRAATGQFEYLKLRAGFVLAGMDSVKYRSSQLQLEPGDKIYLYTDGITEATDASQELYGEDRLLATLNHCGSVSVKDICNIVKKNVDEFVGEAPQFDDMTMLCLVYKAQIKEEEDA